MRSNLKIPGYVFMTALLLLSLLFSFHFSGTPFRYNEGYQILSIHIDNSVSDDSKSVLKKSTSMNKPERYLILSAGMDRSGSTWQFNVLRLLMGNLTDVVSGWKLDKKNFTEHKYAIVKAHSYVPLANDTAWTKVLTFTSHRDIRDVCASQYRLYNQTPCVEIEKYIKSHIKLSNISVYDMAYEKFLHNQEEAVISMAEALTNHLPGYQWNEDLYTVNQIVKTVNLQAKEQSKDERQNNETFKQKDWISMYNKTTHFHIGHITDGKWGSFKKMFKEIPNGKQLCILPVLLYSQDSDYHLHSLWGYINMCKSKTWSFLWKRSLLSIIAVIYISYLGLTKLTVKVFHCVRVFDSENHLASSWTWYWAVDTPIKCYGKEHSALISVGVIVLALVNLCFPFISASVITNYKDQRQNSESWINETMRFLYRAFKDRFRYWESIVMVRKAFLSVIIVFSYPLGGQLQASLALLPLILSLCLQTVCMPYREEFSALNHYESASLFISSVTLILSQFLDSGQCSSKVKLSIIFFIVCLNVTTFLVLLLTFLASGVDHMKATLEEEGIQIPDDVQWWGVIKIVWLTKLSQWKVWAK
eukprot:g6410.t1